jgi:nicotinamide-nucleotide amidase
MAEALDAAVPPQADALAQRVLRQACDKHLRLATAESCTGGLLASLLTDLPGMSHAFERGFVSYTHAAKTEMLGVSPRILQTDGAVSEAAARAMAQGALAHSHADLAVSVTGFTEGAPGQPAGLVHLACARRGGPLHHLRMEYGDLGRAKVRIAALQTALEMLQAQLQTAKAAAAAEGGPTPRPG